MADPYPGGLVLGHGHAHAHVFWNPYAGNWSIGKKWNVMRVSRRQYQFGPITETGYSTYVTYCYWVDAPAGAKTYSSGGMNWYWDYAAVDFSICGYNPWFTFGYSYAGYGSWVDYYNANTVNYGYDGSPTPPNPQAEGSAWYTYRHDGKPSMIGRSCWHVGCIWLETANGWQIKTTELDQTGGMSGLGAVGDIFRTVGDGTWYWIGVWGHWTQPGDPLPHYNSARRLDPAVWQFVTDLTTEW